MNYEFIDCDIFDSIATITFLGSETPISGLTDELLDLMLRLQEDKAVRVIVFKDSEGSFNFNFDASTIAEQRADDASTKGFFTDLEEIRRIVTLMQESSKPIVAAISGEVNGGGLGLIAACDIRIASKSATFTAPDIRTGIMSDWGLTATLPKLVGNGKAMELLLSGRTVATEEAYTIGLVDRMIDYEAVDEFLEHLMTLPQPAVQLTKMAVQQSGQFDITTMLSLEMESQQQCWDGEETSASMNATITGEIVNFNFTDNQIEE
jgi:enoyl-CoA hydratase/carnithine racemase